eukprot:CAMPEP_0182531854 /NCGR_PEP_ID=MMETSP1323-20130603/10192_1 /TAXON_ID=236787 /ORGANISM="Florenciella parvula, Strain RCC1693" /LENGTH=185 /DNA_ID=CAMNT_0024741499 /DNA_START=48 /DNA_END=605 /DNA_ORIENTATION=+
MGTAVSITSPKATEQAKKGPQYSFGEGHAPARQDGGSGGPPASPGGTPLVKPEGLAQRVPQDVPENFFKGPIQELGGAQPIVLDVPELDENGVVRSRRRSSFSVDLYLQEQAVHETMEASQALAASMASTADGHEVGFEHFAPSIKEIEGAVPVSEASDPLTDAQALRAERGSGGAPIDGVGLQC